MQNKTTALQQRFFLLPLAIDTNGDEPWYCLFAQIQVVGVLGRRTIYPVPFSPGYLKGCIEWQDSVVPVIDVDLLCGGKEKNPRTPLRQLLLVRTGQIDAVSGEPLKLALKCTSTVSTFKPSVHDNGQIVAENEVPPALAAQDLSRGYFRLRNYRVMLLDLDGIVQGKSESTKRVGGDDGMFLHGSDG
ncbi:MAG: chemotaxis protein CheW [Desulfobulbaceae bacterium]|nr:chemotaxis protein CheW [Desulfobulbaceae bacterium]